LTLTFTQQLENLQIKMLVRKTLRISLSLSFTAVTYNLQFSATIREI